MKKIFLAILLSGTVISVDAQTDQGDWLVGGNFRVNTSDNNTVISLTPSAALFVINNLAVGGNLDFTYSKNGTRKTTQFGIGPWVRYYFTDASVRPILQGNFNFTTEKTKIVNVSTNNTGINLFLGGGAAIFISDQVSIDGLMGYYHSKLSGFSGSGAFAFSVGFQVYLLKNQMDKVRGK